MGIHDLEQRQEAEREKNWRAFLDEHRADPPDHLSDRSKELWRHAVPSQIRCAERLALLTAGLEALDRAEQARLAIATEGLTTKTARSGVLHVHPLVKVEREARQQFASIWTALDLNRKDISPPQNAVKRY